MDLTKIGPHVLILGRAYEPIVQRIACDSFTRPRTTKRWHCIASKGFILPRATNARVPIFGELVQREEDVLRRVLVIKMVAVTE